LQERAQVRQVSVLERAASLRARAVSAGCPQLERAEAPEQPVAWAAAAEARVEAQAAAAQARVAARAPLRLWRAAANLARCAAAAIKP
jgi:hypothetical protein